METLAGTNPRLLYRVYVSDGHKELVRGAVFNELDTRTVRNNLVAAGSDPLVSNREGSVPTTVIAPSILFDELKVKRTDSKNAKLPQYPRRISPARSNSRRTTWAVDSAFRFVPRVAAQVESPVWLPSRSFRQTNFR